MTPQVTPYEPGTIIEELPLFPLPEAVLFTGMHMPLHIFELRYRAMTEHVLSGARQMAVVLLESGPSDAYGQPAIARIAGVGEIVHHQALADGRYNIVLQGRGRVRLHELPFIGPFRRARAVVLDENQGTPRDADLASLVYSASRFASLLKKKDHDFELHLRNAQDPAAPADACAYQLIVESQERQRILETLDVGERVQRCIEMIAVQAALLSAQNGESPS